MNTLIDIKELKATWYYASKVSGYTYHLLDSTRRLAGGFPDEAEIILAQTKRDQDFCDAQIELVYHNPDHEVIREVFVRLNEEYTWLTNKLKNSLRHLYGHKKKQLEEEYENLLGLNSSFFFQWKERTRKLADKFRGYEYGDPPIDEGRIRNWIRQFGNEEAMEIGLRLLNSVEFIRFENIRQKYKNYYSQELIVNKDKIVLIDFLSTPQSTPVMDTVFVKALNSCNKKITINDVTNFKSVLNKSNYKNKLCVLVEDIVGTGKQYSDAFTELVNEDVKKKYKYVKREDRLNQSEKQKLKELCGVFLVFTVTQQGATRIKQSLETYCPNIKLVNLSNSFPPKCFDNNTNYRGRSIFDSPSQSSMAERLCHEIGYDLLKDIWPDEEERKEHTLGYGNSQQLLVFSHTCPNNTLPVFWKKGHYKSKPWEPLFPKP